MQTVTDNLNKVADEIQDLLKDLLLNHSVIVDVSSDWVVSISGNYGYKKLGDIGRQVQGHLLEKYNRFYAFLAVLLKEQPRDTLNELSRADKVIKGTIEQTRTHCKNTQEAFERAINALNSELQLLNHLYDSSDGQVIYVPDTNALLHNPDLETWIFSGVSKFTIVLLPTVLSELDSLKINHRNEKVRIKAEKLIRKIKDYRRRGRLTSGVTVVKDKIQIEAIAIEPNMDTFLPWLESGNNDDRILAGAIEVMRARSRSPVLIISRDINLQNKAEFANIPFEEPPEPN